MTIDPTPDVGRRALAKLKGHTLRVPDPSPWYADLPSGFNKYYDQLGPVVDELLAGLTSDPKALRKAKIIDVAYLTCALFPLAEWDALLIFTHYTIWIFLWDDETDQELPGFQHATANGDGGDSPLTPTIASDLSLGDAYRAQSLRYIGHQLGFHDNSHKNGASDCRNHLETARPDDNDDDDSGLVPPTPASGLFAFMGRELRARCDDGELSRFWQQIRSYVAATAVEQDMRLAGRFPGLGEFWRMRYFSGGVLIHTALAVMRCGNGATVSMSDLDEHIQEQLDIMQDGLNKNVLVMNDIFSLKKELAEGTLLNMIPIAVAETDNSCAAATVASAVTQLEETARLVVAAGAEVRRQVRQQDRQLPPGHADSAEAFATCLELMLHGFLRWTLHTDRYGVKKFAQPDGSFAIQL